MSSLDISPAPRPHIPVMLAEVLDALAPADGELIIDGTFGAGGYTRAILEAAPCRVTAFDRDITAIRMAAAPGGLLAAFPGRLTLINAPFSEMAEHVPHAEAIVLDIGVSSMQIDDPTRGFSFQSDGPLDMRMSATGESNSKIRAPCTSRGCCALFFFGKSAVLGFRFALRRSDLVI